MDPLGEFKQMYAQVCPDSDKDDFGSTYNKFDSWAYGEPEPVNTGDLDYFGGVFGVKKGAVSKPYFSEGTYMPDVFQNWLRGGNCPPPRTPQARVRVLSYEETARNAGSRVVPGNKRSGSSTKDFLVENWKGFAVAGGLVATAWTLWGTSAILVADDITGVGLADDPALAVTVPAASMATAGTVATITALAASALLYLGMGKSEVAAPTA